MFQIYTTIYSTSIFDFVLQSRIPFQVPERVAWPQLAHALNTKFVNHCGLGLSNNHFNYLASKLFG